MKIRILPAITAVLMAIVAGCLIFALIAQDYQIAPPPVTVMQAPDDSVADPTLAPTRRETARPGELELVTAIQPASDEVPLTKRIADESSLDEIDPDEPVQFAEGHASKSLRNRSFPQTYISAIHVSLTSPFHGVELTWTGPDAARMETGPFHSSPGAGLGYNNCDDHAESNRSGSNCTPKGTFAVEGFSDYLPSYPRCRFVTWFNIPREVAFHSHWQVPRSPASHGCVRLDPHAAQLIHNNSLVDKTKVTVNGTWSRRGRY